MDDTKAPDSPAGEMDADRLQDGKLDEVSGGINPQPLPPGHKPLPT